MSPSNAAVCTSLHINAISARCVEWEGEAGDRRSMPYPSNKLWFISRVGRCGGKHFQRLTNALIAATASEAGRGKAQEEEG